MLNEFARLYSLIGEDNFLKLRQSKIIVFGIGGVGSYAAEALTRSGIGRIDIVDYDNIDITNINRQIIALHSTVGKAKTDVMKERMKDINPEIEVNTFKIFYNEETADEIDLKNYDYIVDAVDTVTSKLLLIKKAKERNIPIISSMGTGNKFHPEMLETADIKKTSVCPLARVMRRELKALGIDNLKVVFSKEEPLQPLLTEEKSNRKQIPGSTAFVPSSAGLLIASEVIKDLIK